MTASIIITVAILCQSVEFGDSQNLATVRGSEKEIIRFYEQWRAYVQPNWHSCQKREWWFKEFDRVADDARTTGKTLYSYRQADRPALWITILRMDCVFWFKVSVSPFGSFWFPYRFSVHVGLTIAFLLACVVALRFRDRIRKRIAAIVVDWNI